jgi:DNA-binding MarR family transcriptional regulator
MQLDTPCTCFAVRRLSRQVTQIYDRHLAQLGLKTTQYSLMSWVRGLPGVSLGALAARMGMDRSTLTRNLRPLIDAGWVGVQAGEDARSLSAELTDAGRALLAEARGRWRQAQLELETTLGRERARSLHRLVEDASVRLATPD